MHRNLIERKTRQILLCMVFVVIMLPVAGFSSEAPATAAVTEEPMTTEQATLSPTAAPTVSEQQEPTEVVEETKEPQPDVEDAASTEEVSACLACHTDQAMLIDTANPIEEVESENEGAG